MGALSHLHQPHQGPPQHLAGLLLPVPHGLVGNAQLTPHLAQVARAGGEVPAFDYGAVLGWQRRHCIPHPLQEVGLLGRAGGVGVRSVQR